MSNEEHQPAGKHIQTKKLKLVAHTLEDIRVQIEGMDAEQRAELSPDWLARVRGATVADPWTLGFALVQRPTDAVIGTCGFRRVGEVMDPEDGLVWRWETYNDEA